MTDGEYDIGNRLIDYDEENYDEDLVYYGSVIDLLAQNEIDINQYKLAKFVDEYEFQIPEYQRNYEWEEPQWEDLWVEIEKLFDASLSTEGESTPDVFFGSMFFAKRGTAEGGNTDVVEVIDGQQRLTTLSIFFKVVTDVLDTVEPETEECRGMASALRNTIQGVLYLPSSIPGRQRPALNLNEHNREFYAALVGDAESRLSFIRDRESVHGNRKRHAIRVHDYADKLSVPPERYERYENDNKHFDNANDRILRAYRYFYEHLSESLVATFETGDERVRALTNVVNYVLNSFIVGYFEITSNRSSLMMNVFQILNDRGMNLKKVDIIRARIVSRLRENGNEDADDVEKFEAMIDTLDNDYGDVEDFLIDYITANEDGISSKTDVTKNLLEAFEQGTNGNRTVDPVLTTKEETRAFLEDAETYSEYYHRIIDPDRRIELRDDTREERVNEIITRLNKLGYEQWRPLVLLVYSEVRENATDENEAFFVDLLKVIENVSCRISLTNVYPSKQDPVYVAACQSFRRRPFDRSLFEEIVDDVKDRAQQLFFESFVDTVNENYDWSNAYARTLLWKMTSETFYAADGAVENRLNVDDIHLEHVLPQSPIRSGATADERYGWLRHFFGTEEGDSAVAAIIERLIADDSIEERDSQLREIADYFVHDLGNMVLLQSEDNISIGNKPFSEKILTYYDETDFEAIRVNEYFTTDGGEITETDIDRLRSETPPRSLDGFWNYRRLTERKTALLEALLESVAFDGILDDEFEPYDVPSKVARETNRRLGLIEANYRAVVERD